MPGPEYLDNSEVGQGKKVGGQQDTIIASVIYKKVEPWEKNTTRDFLATKDPIWFLSQEQLAGQTATILSQDKAGPFWSLFTLPDALTCDSLHDNLTCFSAQPAWQLTLSPRITAMLWASPTLSLPCIMY